ncbi:MAG: PEP-CTERM sorting domain-containing protein [Pirellulales bacterium]|nr:PEP-CTERM sorting domain-containing protein [Pirellulales bacterium]
MNRLLVFLAIALMACPILVARGATYSDNFDGANPQKPWLIFDEYAQGEYWDSSVGPYPTDITSFDVSYGGTATLNDADLDSSTPQFLGSILCQPGGSWVNYTDGVTVQGILNPDTAYSAGSTTDEAVVGFVQEGGTYGTGLHFYCVTYSAIDHELALFAIRNSGWLLRLDKVDVPVTSPMNVPVKCTLQAQEITTGDNAGKVSLVGKCYGDVGSGYTVLAELSAIAGVTDPDYQSGGTTHNVEDVPILTEGAVGFGGLTDASDSPLYASCDDFLSRDPVNGDFNLDAAVDVSDLGILAANYGTLTGMTILEGDADMNGAVDVSDLGILAANYGTGAAAAVPEPATLTLLSVAGLLFLIRRKK